MVNAAFARIAAVAGVSALLAACSSSSPAPETKEYFSVKEYGPASPQVVSDGRPVPKGGGRYQLGKPYRVAGKTYVPRDNPNYSATGNASWYGDAFHGRKTANGEIYDMHDLTAAHPTLPLPSYVRVTNLENGRSVVVRVNDRGPFAHNRLIDVSKTVAGMLGFEKRGVAKVKVDYIGKADLHGRDRAKLMASYRDPSRPINNMLASAARLPIAKPPPLLKSTYQPDYTLQPVPLPIIQPATQPAYTLRGGTDPLAPLILNSGLSSFAPVKTVSPALAAISDVTGAPVRAHVVVQIATFSDPANARRAADAFTHLGRVQIDERRRPDRPTVQVVRVAVNSGAGAAEVINAAARVGLDGAFIVSQ